MLPKPRLAARQDARGEVAEREISGRSRNNISRVHATIGWPRQLVVWIPQGQEEFQCGPHVPNQLQIPLVASQHRQQVVGATQVHPASTRIMLAIGRTFGPCGEIAGEPGPSFLRWVPTAGLSNSARFMVGQANRGTRQISVEARLASSAKPARGQCAFSAGLIPVPANCFRWVPLAFRQCASARHWQDASGTGDYLREDVRVNTFAVHPKLP